MGLLSVALDQIQRPAWEYAVDRENARRLNERISRGDCVGNVLRGVENRRVIETALTRCADGLTVVELMESTGMSDSAVRSALAFMEFRDLAFVKGKRGRAEVWHRRRDGNMAEHTNGDRNG